VITMMKKAKTHTVSELCQAFDLSPSSYYYKPIDVLEKHGDVIEKIKTISIESHHTYGKRRIHAELKDQGIKIGIYQTKTLMDVVNIDVIVPRKRHYYPDSGDEHKYAPNLVNREFKPDSLNTIWAGDITYVRNHQGWSYLATVMDLCSNQIVGHATSTRADADLAKQALSNAIRKHKPNTNGLIFHSDQGSQYSSKKFRRFLKLLNITQSMSRRGNCWDNAVMERFFRSLKHESLYHQVRHNHQDTVEQINRYIYFYNYRRRHSAIQYMTPNQKAQEMKNAA
jgi:putative transposase